MKQKQYLKENTDSINYKRRENNSKEIKNQDKYNAIKRIKLISGQKMKKRLKKRQNNTILKRKHLLKED